jgi:putative ATP-dependent endonuclease of OLD family
VFISNLFVENYRSLKSFSIILKPRTLIIGENNIGKTNLLRALALLLNNEIGGYRKRSLNLEDFNYDVLQKFKSDVADITIKPEDLKFPSITINATFSHFNNEDEEAIVSEWYDDDSHSTASLKYIFYCGITNKVKWVESVRENLVAFPFGLLPEETQKAHRSRIDGVDLPISDYKYKFEAGRGNIKPDSFQLEPLKIDFLDALRDAKTELSASRENRLLYRILNNRDDARYGDIKDSADALNKSIADGGGELSNIKSDISTLLEILSLETESSTNNINFSFSGLGVTELLKKISLEYGDKPIAVENNGLGRNNLLYMALVLSHIQEKSGVPDFRLVAIEEPESHISPILQKHFSENVTSSEFFNDSSNRQVILTSHSTHISSYLNLDNTVIMFSDAGNFRSHYILDGIEDNAAGKKTKSYLKKWLCATNSVMFFSRRLIFVEGIAEKILLPKLFELHFGATLEKKNCQIVNVNGVAFRNFLEIVNNGYYIKSAVLTDSDANTITGQRAPALKKDYDSDKIFVSISEQTTFEKELISSNSTGQGRTKLKNTIKSTRPSKFKEIEKVFLVKLKVDEIFGVVEDYKSEFAFDLLDELGKPGGFKIPKYIINAFDFVCED